MISIQRPQITDLRQDWLYSQALVASVCSFDSEKHNPITGASLGDSGARGG